MMILCPDMLRYTTTTAFFVWLAFPVDASFENVTVQAIPADGACQQEISVSKVSSAYHFMSVATTDCSNCQRDGSCRNGKERKCPVVFKLAHYLQDLYRLCYFASDQHVNCSCPPSPNVRKKKRRSCGPKMFFEERGGLNSEEVSRLGTLSCAKREGLSRCIPKGSHSLSVTYKGTDFCGLTGHSKIYMKLNAKNIYNLSNWRRCGIYSGGTPKSGYILSQLDTVDKYFPQKCSRALYPPSSWDNFEFCITFTHADFQQDGAILKIGFQGVNDNMLFDSDHKPIIDHSYCLKHYIKSRVTLTVDADQSASWSQRFKHSFVFKYYFREVNEPDPPKDKEEEEDDDNSMWMIVLYIIAAAIGIVILQFVYRNFKDKLCQDSLDEDSQSRRDSHSSPEARGQTRIFLNDFHENDSGDESSDSSAVDRRRPDTSLPAMPPSAPPLVPSSVTPLVPPEPLSTSSLPPSYAQVMDGGDDGLVRRSPMSPSAPTEPVPSPEEDRVQTRRRDSDPPPPAYSSLFPDQV